MNKVIKNVSDAVQGIEDNMTLMLGGFGLCEFLKIQLQHS